MPLAYTKKDVGCYIDGAFGEDHRRARLAELVNEVIASISHPGEIQTGKELVAELRQESSDDLSEEDDAVSFLQDHTEDGLVWVFTAGDLILTSEEDAEAL